MRCGTRPRGYPYYSGDVEVLEFTEADRRILRKAVCLLTKARAMIDRPGSDLDFEIATAERSCQHLVDVSIFGYIEIE